jgi:anti-sigma regulatory factor (Ser/Thr protein kinase)
MNEPQRARPSPQRIGAEVGHDALRLEMPAAHANGRAARALVRQFAQNHGISGNALETLVLVADELLTNAVDHGGGEGTMEEADLRRPVRMQLALAVVAGGWELSVSDQGGGDPATLDELLHPQDLPNLEDERGRGFYLMAQMVDSITVRVSDDRLGLCVVAKCGPGAR